MQCVLILLGNLDCKSRKSASEVKHGSSSLRASGTPPQSTPIPNLGCTPLPKTSESTPQNAKELLAIEGSPKSAQPHSKKTPMITPSSVFSTPFSPTTDSFMKYVNDSAPDTDEREMSIDGILDDSSSSEPRGEDLMACMEEEVETKSVNGDEAEAEDADKEVEKNGVDEEDAPSEEVLQPNNNKVCVVEALKNSPNETKEVLNATPIAPVNGSVAPPFKSTSSLPSSSLHAKDALSTLALATLCTFGVVTLTLTGLAYAMYDEPQPAFESFPSSI